MSKTNLMPARIVIDNDLSLRRLVLEDADSLFKIIREAPEIKQNVTWPADVNSLEDAQNKVRQLITEDRYNPYVLEENGVIIGYLGTWGFINDQHQIGFSYFLAKDKRGRGYITRGLKSLMKTVKENLPINTFVVNIIDANEPSKAVALKLGFKATNKLMKDELLRAILRRYERPA